MDWDDMPHAEQLRRQRDLTRAHREMAADRQESQFGPPELADQAHVAEERGWRGD